MATELELQQAVISEGVALTSELWRAMLRELEADPHILTRRCLMYNAYELIDNADNAEANA